MLLIESNRKKDEKSILKNIRENPQKSEEIIRREEYFVCAQEN